MKLNKKNQSGDKSEIITLDCGIKVVKRPVIPEDFHEFNMTSAEDFVLYEIGRLIVSVTYPGSNYFTDGVVFNDYRITALAFHGANYGGKWVARSNLDVSVKKIVEEIEKKQNIDALLVCNPTQEDIERNDLIYIVNNEACPHVRRTSPVFELQLFPKIHGGGYWSVFGKKHQIPFPRKQLEQVLTY